MQLAKPSSATTASSLNLIRTTSSISVNKRKINSYTTPASTNDFVTDSWNRRDCKGRYKAQTWPRTYMESMLEGEQTSSSYLAAFNSYSMERWLMVPSNESSIMNYANNDYGWTSTNHETELPSTVGSCPKPIRYYLSSDTAFAGSWVDDYDW
jgi:hypothetical protein